MKLKTNFKENKKIKDVKQINMSQPVFYSPQLISPQEFLLTNINKNSIEFNKAYRPQRNLDGLYKKWFTEAVNVKPIDNFLPISPRSMPGIKNKISFSQSAYEEKNSVGSSARETKKRIRNRIPSVREL
jgi:hypothetical protein